MNYTLNPEFNYIYDSHQKTGYITNRSGKCSIVNEDAYSFLQQLQDNQNNYKHLEFIEQCLQLKWISSNQQSQKVEFRSVSTSHHLKRVQFEILLKCNLSCAHCYCSSSPFAFSGMSTEVIKNFIDQMSAMGVIYFDITGGEPLLRKDIFEIIEYAQEKGLIVSLFTNSTLLTDERVDKLKKLQISSIQTSLDAFSEEIHDDFRNQKGSFRKAVSGIQRLVTAKIPVSVTVVVNKKNKHEIHKLVHFLKNDLKVPFRLDRMIPSGRALSHDDISLSNAEFYKVLKEIFPFGKPLVTKVCDFSNANLNKQHIEPSCGVGASYIFVKANGDVCLCPTMTESESKSFKISNIQKESLDEIWQNHPVFQKYRGIQCENINVCPAASSCKGGCRSNAYLLHDYVDSPDEFYCNLYKNDSKNYIPYLERYRKEKKAL